MNIATQMNLAYSTITEACNHTLKIGDVLNDKWVILEFIGRGGMGEVFRAYQVNLKRDVAIKVISLNFLESLDCVDDETETVLQRFRREVQVMAQLNYPNIAQVIDHDTVLLKNGDGERRIEYIAMEYISGGTLKDTLPQDGFFPEEDATAECIRNLFMPVLESGLRACLKTLDQAR